jgi:hypothetical protein
MLGVPMKLEYLFDLTESQPLASGDSIENPAWAGKDGVHQDCGGSLLPLSWLPLMESMNCLAQSFAF